MEPVNQCTRCGAILTSFDSQAECPACLLGMGLEKGGDSASHEDHETVGRYRVMEKIGSGGMGHVYRGKDPELNRTVAIKFLPQQLMNSRDSLQRFQREAATLSQLNNINICQVYDVGQSRRGPYIVMEYVKGRTLASVLEEEELPLERCLEVLRQICSGLKPIHEKGMVHRDLKPSNIMVTDEGVVKIVDFGLAKWNPDLDPSWTSYEHEKTTGYQRLQTTEGQVMGTPSYMSPEQASGLPVDSRSDIFSLGALFYRMLAGKPPFVAETPMLTLHTIVSRQYTRLLSVDSTLPKSVEKVVDRMLEEPDKRYQDIQELDADLKAETENVSSPPGPVKLKKESSNHHVRENPGQPVLGWSGMLIAVLLVSAGLAGILAWNFRPAEKAVMEKQAVNFGKSEKRSLEKNTKEPARGNSSDEPEEKGAKGSSLDAIEKKERVSRFETRFITRVVIDSTQYLNQAAEPGKLIEDPGADQFHQMLRLRLNDLCEGKQIPVTLLGDGLFDSYYDKSRQAGGSYGDAVAACLDEQEANLFLSISGCQKEGQYTFNVGFFNRKGDCFHQGVDLSFEEQQVQQLSMKAIHKRFDQWFEEKFPSGPQQKAEWSGENGFAFESVVVKPITAFDCNWPIPFLPTGHVDALSNNQDVDWGRVDELQEKIAEKIEQQGFDDVTIAKFRELEELSLLPGLVHGEELADLRKKNQAVLEHYGVKGQFDQFVFYDTDLLTSYIELRYTRQFPESQSILGSFAVPVDEMESKWNQVVERILSIPLEDNPRREACDLRKNTDWLNQK
ncbi:MAG: serine/threonine-protein kinase [Planctomycetota bacterium]|nr:serine/threonine-protein kinase [Planctomycetota bacterium]